MKSKGRSRLAPSPTGALHLGNAQTFLINWALARQLKWDLVLRIEDLDHPRVKPETIPNLIEDLKWIGLDWDHELPLQSSDTEPMYQALCELGTQGRIFRCHRSRAEVAAAQSAPQDQDHGLRYDPSLRPADAGQPVCTPDREATWRFLTDDRTFMVNDQCAGTHAIRLDTTCGDFPVWTPHGPSYQLAVAVDDARHHITDVVRGNDLLPSAARQQAILDTLSLPIPQWWHLPLVRGEDGRRLAKRHGDTRIASFRDQGVDPSQLIGYLAQQCGCNPDGGPMTAAIFKDCFDILQMPQQDAILSQKEFPWPLG